MVVQHGGDRLQSAVAGLVADGRGHHRIVVLPSRGLVLVLAGRDGGQDVLVGSMTSTWRLRLRCSLSR
jgi:hypothetical protein